jgi:hypothetical protein
MHIHATAISASAAHPGSAAKPFAAPQTLPTPAAVSASRFSNRPTYPQALAKAWAAAASKDGFIPAGVL